MSVLRRSWRAKTKREPLAGAPEIGVIAAVGLAWYFGVQAAGDAETVQGMSLGVAWMALATFVLYRREKRVTGSVWWPQLIILAAGLRVILVFVHLLVGLQFYAGQVDFVGYGGTASIGNLFLQLDGGAVIETIRDGRTFELMLGLFYLLVGPSLVGMFFLSGILGLVGSYLFLEAFRVAVGRGRGERFAGVLLLFLPSLVFWSGLLGKDSWVVLFLGMVSCGFARLLRGYSHRHAAILVVGLAGLAVVRTLVAAVPAAVIGLFLYLNWRPRGPAAVLRPLGLAVIAAVAVAATAGISYVYLREYRDVLDPAAIESLLELAIIKHQGLATAPSGGGSSLSLEVKRPSLRAMSWYLPGGILTFLFRPLIFEAHHAIALLAALDGTVLIVLVLSRLRNLLAALRSTFRVPFIGYCLGVFLLLTAMLSFERNLGVIVRHRSMVLPYLIVLLAVPRPARRLPNLERDSTVSA